MMGVTGASETAREREVFKYYQPTTQFRPDAPILPPQSSDDAALTAFAQLGALRLDAKRGMISLVARELQYVIAEATQSLSLRNDTVHENTDELWKGETILRRRDGPCSVAMDLFTGVVEGDRDHIMVSDLSADDRFSHMGPVAEFPFMKFFVGVPLVSARGLVVGTFYVVDDKPRNGLPDAELVFMKDVAWTIMAHLEAKRMKQQHKRAERMIRGLGLYVEGKSSLREWWLNTGHKSDDLEVTKKTRQGESLNQQADQEFGIQDSPDDLATATITSMPLSLQRGRLLFSDNGSQAAINGAPRKGRPQVGQDDRSDTTADSTSLSAAHDTTFTKQIGTNPTLTKASSTASNEPVQDMPQNHHNSSIDLQDETSGARLQEAVLFSELKESFSRASNLIRESIAVDGALFLDASIGTFGGSSSKTVMGFTGSVARIDEGKPFTTSSSDEARQSGLPPGSSQKMCGILGYSTSKRSSINMHEPSLLHSSVSEDFLRKLLRRYPHGKVFNFDDDGSLSSSEDEIRKTLQIEIEATSQTSQSSADRTLQHKRKKKKISREAEGKEILRLLPSARCVAFFPLWDSHKERWFAGSIVWTADPTRVLDPDEDLTYLASFGNSIMAEISRLNALVSSQVKNSFVSSISHELRSPLHGVLASVEFLQDSPLNTLQQEMVNIIGACGRTLLDTLNHVLDFTKLRRSTTDEIQSQKYPSRPKRTRAGSVSSGSLSTQKMLPVDLRVLTEEVLHGVYTGSGFGKSPSINNQRSIPPGSDSSLSVLQPVSPMIILNLDWRENWEFEIDPGAWRRLVMNIFGNALKYTEAGFVRISLESTDSKGSSRDTSPTMVTLIATDSGKGISKEFLNHHLYTPFAQEDSLAVGSGLGLSIVRHIVNELGGNITVESEQESGTEVTISLPLTPTKPSVGSGTINDSIFQVRDQVQGLQMRLVGFDVIPNIVDEPTGILSLEAKRMFYFRDSLTSLLKDWFRMEVTIEATLKPAPRTISFIMESVFDQLLSAGLPGNETDQAPRAKPVVLVLCSKQFKPYPAIGHSAFKVIYVQQPIGPQKLANVLTTCLPSIIRQEDEPVTDGLPVNLVDRVPKNTPTRDPPSHSRPQRPTLSWRKSSQRSIATSIPLSTSSKLGSSGVPSPYAKQTSVLHSPVDTGKAHSHHVLLVEDNAINLKILVTCMEKLGIDYATAENGLIALQEYQDAARQFDLVLMDISMPVMDGVAASRKIRLFEKESNKDRVPIVAITGAASESARQEAFSAGIDQFLTKPVSLKVLKEIVEAYTLPT